APIAAMSAAFWAIALWPTSAGADQSSRKCRPSTSMSVHTVTVPSPARSTAASSPVSTTTRGSGPPSVAATAAAMTANSPAWPTVCGLCCDCIARSPLLPGPAGTAAHRRVPVPWARPPRAARTDRPVRSSHLAATVFREVQTAMSDTADQHDSAPSEPEESAEDASGRSPALIATAVALPLMVLVGVIVFAVLATPSPVLEPVAIGAAEAPEAESEACPELIAAVPDELAGLARAEGVDPGPRGAAAWQDPDDPDAEEVVLRCGLDRPHEFVQNSPLQVVGDVEWLEVDGAADGLESSTWTAVDRGV